MKSKSIAQVFLVIALVDTIVFSGISITRSLIQSDIEASNQTAAALQKVAPSPTDLEKITNSDAQAALSSPALYWYETPSVYVLAMPGASVTVSAQAAVQAQETSVVSSKTEGIKYRASYYLNGALQSGLPTGAKISLDKNNRFTMIWDVPASMNIQNNYNFRIVASDSRGNTLAAPISWVDVAGPECSTLSDASKSDSGNIPGTAISVDPKTQVAVAIAKPALCATEDASISGQGGPVIVKKTEVNAACLRLAAPPTTPLYIADFRQCKYPESFADACPLDKCNVSWPVTFGATCSATPVGATTTVAGGGSGSFSIMVRAGCGALLTDAGKAAVMKELMTRINNQMSKIMKEAKYACPAGSSQAMTTTMSDVVIGGVQVAIPPYKPVTATVDWTIMCRSPGNDAAYTVDYKVAGAKHCSIKSSGTPKSPVDPKK
ncbi:MAG: hypothetical protein WCG02_01050 [Candidatus Taylorbacteria bacterium]